MVDVAHIPTAGPIKVVKLEESGDTTLLRAMQEMVGGGFIEMIRLHCSCDLWIDEEGGIKMPRPDRNPLATRIVEQLALHETSMYGGAIFGPAFVSGYMGTTIVDVYPAIMPELIKLAGDRWEGDGV